MCMAGGRSIHDRTESRACAGAGASGARQSAEERRASQWITAASSRVPQSRLEAWVIEHGVQLCSMRPGRPVENAFIESFNGRLRDECLNVDWFFFAGRCPAEAGEAPRAL